MSRFSLWLLALQECYVSVAEMIFVTLSEHLHETCQLWQCVKCPLLPSFCTPPDNAMSLPRTWPLLLCIISTNNLTFLYSHKMLYSILYLQIWEVKFLTFQITINRCIRYPVSRHIRSYSKYTSVSICLGGQLIWKPLIFWMSMWIFLLAWHLSKYILRVTC